MNPLPKTSREPASTAALFAPLLPDLEEVERILAKALGDPRPHVAQLVAHLNPYRGKRLRPTLLLLTAQACGRVTPAHHVLGAVVEMIHTATLVHDDVLDGAAVRRHVPTVNARWGNQTSILLGDYLFTHAFHLTSTLNDARACRADRRGDQPGLRGRAAPGLPARQPGSERGGILRHHRRQDRGADFVLLPTRRRCTPACPRR